MRQGIEQALESGEGGENGVSTVLKKFSIVYNWELYTKPWSSTHVRATLKASMHCFSGLSIWMHISSNLMNSVKTL